MAIFHSSEGSFQGSHAPRPDADTSKDGLGSLSGDPLKLLANTKSKQCSWIMLTASRKLRALLQRGPKMQS